MPIISVGNRVSPIFTGTSFCKENFLDIIIEENGFDLSSGERQRIILARSLMKKRSDVHIDVVLASSSSRALTCLASTTGGHFYSVNNLSDFSTTLTKSIQQEPATPAEIKKQSYEFISE